MIEIVHLYHTIAENFHVMCDVSEVARQPGVSNFA
jgi:hypothetical protein